MKGRNLYCEVLVQEVGTIIYSNKYLTFLGSALFLSTLNLATKGNNLNLAMKGKNLNLVMKGKNLYWIVLTSSEPSVQSCSTCLPLPWRLFLYFIYSLLSSIFI